jgi:hypothetical protein
MSHRTGIAARCAALGFLLFGSLVLFGQENSPNSQPNPDRTAKSGVLVNVTGCLKKTASGGYYVSDQQGRTWELTSKKVDLAKQVFHTVSVSGHPSSTVQPQEGKSEQDRTPQADDRRFALDVTELEMVSNSCTR